MGMERITISVSDDFTEELTHFMAANGYENRSEAIRDLARAGLEKAQARGGGSGQCLATLTYVFNHHTRKLSRRLTEAHHGRHDLEVATLHVHLDHDNCLEVAVLRGEVEEVRTFANALIAERGVLHGHISFVPVEVNAADHAHDHGGSDHHPHPHDHVHPRA